MLKNLEEGKKKEMIMAVAKSEKIKSADMKSLNEQLQTAMRTGDHKTATEVTAKIKKQQAAAGISPYV